MNQKQIKIWKQQVKEAREDIFKDKEIDYRNTISSKERNRIMDSFVKNRNDIYK